MEQISRANLGFISLLFSSSFSGIQDRQSVEALILMLVAISRASEKRLVENV